MIDICVLCLCHCVISIFLNNLYALFHFISLKLMFGIRAWLLSFRGFLCCWGYNVFDISWVFDKPRSMGALQQWFMCWKILESSLRIETDRTLIYGICSCRSRIVEFFVSMYTTYWINKRSPGVQFHFSYQIPYYWMYLENIVFWNYGII